MAQTNDQQSWSDLPAELVCHVMGRLPDHTDRIRLAAVCRHWCLSARHPGIPPPLPWLVLYDGTFFTLPSGESFRINTPGFRSCSGEWLVFASERNCILYNTFSKATLKLPDKYCFDLIDEPHEVINGHGIPNTVLNTDTGIAVGGKVVVCSQVLAVATVRVGDLFTLAFCRPGAKSWYVSALGKISLPADIVFYEGKVYTVDSEGNLYSIIVEEDIESGKLSLSRIERAVTKVPFFPVPFSGTGHCAIRFYLVESCGALLLVRRRIFRQTCWHGMHDASKAVLIEFEVFKANFQSSQWEKVKNVGDDQVLFVGGRSQSICVSQYRAKGNRIFFLHDTERCFEDAPSSYSIYDMSDGTVHSPLPRGSCKGEKLPATWLFPRG